MFVYLNKDAYIYAHIYIYTWCINWWLRDNSPVSHQMADTSPSAAWNFYVEIIPVGDAYSYMYKCIFVSC